jgi:hypothetical protein
MKKIDNGFLGTLLQKKISNCRSYLCSERQLKVSTNIVPIMDTPILVRKPCRGDLHHTYFE